VRAQDFILKQGLEGYSKSIDATGQGLPMGLGSYAPGIGGPDINNYLDTETGMPTDNQAGSGDEDESPRKGQVGSF